jgi:transcriptional regulator with XRE-family HTH domain
MPFRIIDGIVAGVIYFKDEFITEICQAENVSIEELKGGSRRMEISRVRALIAIGLVKKQGVALAEVARRLGVSTTAISKIIKRAVK